MRPTYPNALGRRLQGHARRTLVGVGSKGWERHYLDGRTTPPRRDVVRLSRYAPARRQEFTYPGDEFPTTLHFLPRFTYLLHDVVVDPLSGNIYDDSIGLIPESSAWPLAQQQMSWPRPFIRGLAARVRTTGRQAVFLPGGLFSGFYHWLLEDLPVVLKSLEIAVDPILVVPSRRASYVNDLLDILQLPLIEIRRPQRISNLVMTGKVAGHGSPFGVASPHPSDVEMLRSYFAGHILPTSAECKLMVSRSGLRRTARNETHLVKELAERGFSLIEPTEYSFIDQIKLFSQASIFIGVHGAAHANCVWMNTGSRVEEIMSKDYVVGYFAILSACIQANYRCYISMADDWNIDDRVMTDVIAAVSEGHYR